MGKDGGFLRWGYPIAGWFINFIRENLTKMDGLGVALF
jgi:hypothetical protein